MRGQCRGHGECSRHDLITGQRGYTLLEAVFVAGLVCLLAAIAVPRLLASTDRSRGLLAARYLAGRMALARAQAVSRSATIALRFEPTSRGITFSVIQDGNHNGVRTSDIQVQVDRVIEPAILLSDLFPGADIGLIPQAPASQAIQIGGTSILSFTPTGTSSSGSIYVRSKDGTQWAVRVLGATARARVLRFVPATRGWVPAS
jgi:type II secretory pathway pseudopilin PulG